VVTKAKIKCKECNSEQLTKSGTNGWRTIHTSNGRQRRVRVQRWICKLCGKYNFSRLNGEPLEENQDTNSENGGTI